jgi:putative transposase
MAKHMRTELVSGALKMAAAISGGITSEIIFDSDRGSHQYMSGDFRQLIGDLEMVRWVGRTGACWTTQLPNRSLIR